MSNGGLQVKHIFFLRIFNLLNSRWRRIRHTWIIVFSNLTLNSTEACVVRLPWATLSVVISVAVGTSRRDELGRAEEPLCPRSESHRPRDTHEPLNNTSVEWDNGGSAEVWSSFKKRWLTMHRWWSRDMEWISHQVVWWVEYRPERMSREFSLKRSWERERARERPYNIHFYIILLCCLLCELSHKGRGK